MSIQLATRWRLLLGQIFNYHWNDRECHLLLIISSSVLLLVYSLLATATMLVLVSHLVAVPGSAVPVAVPHSVVAVPVRVSRSGLSSDNYDSLGKRSHLQSVIKIHITSLLSVHVLQLKHVHPHCIPNRNSQLFDAAFFCRPWLSRYREFSLVHVLTISLSFRAHAKFMNALIIRKIRLEKKKYLFKIWRYTILCISNQYTIQIHKNLCVELGYKRTVLNSINILNVKPKSISATINYCVMNVKCHVRQIIICWPNMY